MLYGKQIKNKFRKIFMTLLKTVSVRLLLSILILTSLTNVKTAADINV
jgi:hypothetical protein